MPNEDLEDVDDEEAESASDSIANPPEDLQFMEDAVEISKDDNDSYSPYEVDVVTERQMFANDIPTRRDSSISSINTFPPQASANPDSDISVIVQPSDEIFNNRLDAPRDPVSQRSSVTAAGLTPEQLEELRHDLRNEPPEQTVTSQPRRLWTPNEDIAIMKLVQSLGANDWVRISG